MWVYILIAVVLLLLLWFIATYNNFVKQKALVNEAFSGMDVYLKKRYDLIPNIVECVKGYMKHEQDTLAKVISLRNQAVSQNGVSEQIAANKELTSQLTKLFALAENYPELKADQQFLSLHKDLTGIEDQIAQSRKYYNGSVKQFNVKVKTVPSNLVASMFHFTEFPFFEIEEAERKAVKVEF